MVNKWKHVNKKGSKKEKEQLAIERLQNQFEEYYNSGDADGKITSDALDDDESFLDTALVQYKNFEANVNNSNELSNPEAASILVSVDNREPPAKEQGTVVSAEEAEREHEHLLNSWKYRPPWLKRTHSFFEGPFF